MESMADKLVEFNKVINNQQAITWAKRFEEDFCNELHNPKKVRDVHIEKTGEQLRKEGTDAIEAYIDSYRKDAMDSPIQEER